MVLGASEHDMSATRQRCSACKGCLCSKLEIRFIPAWRLSASNMYHEVLSVISPCCILFLAT